LTHAVVVTLNKVVVLSNYHVRVFNLIFRGRLEALAKLWLRIELAHEMRIARLHCRTDAVVFVAAFWIELGDEAGVAAGTVVCRNIIIASDLDPLVDTRYELFDPYCLRRPGQVERLASVLDEEKVGVVIRNAAIYGWLVGCLALLTSVPFT